MFKDSIPALFDFSEPEEDLHNFYVNEFEGRNTRCKILYNKGNNTYFVHLPYRVFPDFKKLQQSLPVFFIHQEAKVYFTLTEPKSGIYYKCRAQKANTTTTPRYRVTFPKKIREAFQLKEHDIVNFIQQGDVYLCEFDYKYTPKYE